MPDRELVQLAEKGQLRDDKVLDAQIRRIDGRLARAGRLALRVPHAMAASRSARAPPIRTRRSTRPIFQNNLGELMTLEVMLFADAIMVEDRSILEFIDADWASSAIRSRSTMAWRTSPARSSRPARCTTGIA